MSTVRTAPLFPMYMTAVEWPIRIDCRRVPEDGQHFNKVFVIHTCASISLHGWGDTRVSPPTVERSTRMQNGFQFVSDFLTVIIIRAFILFMIIFLCVWDAYIFCSC